MVANANFVKSSLFQGLKKLHIAKPPIKKLQIAGTPCIMLRVPHQQREAVIHSEILNFRILFEWYFNMHG